MQTLEFRIWDSEVSFTSGIDLVVEFGVYRGLEITLAIIHDLSPMVIDEEWAIDSVWECSL